MKRITNMALIAIGFTRLLGTRIPCGEALFFFFFFGEALLSVTAVFDHVVWLRPQLSPSPSPPPSNISGEAKKTCICKFSITDSWLFGKGQKIGPAPSMVFLQDICCCCFLKRHRVGRTKGFIFQIRSFFCSKESFWKLTMLSSRQSKMWLLFSIWSDTTLHTGVWRKVTGLLWGCQSNTM